MNELQVLRNDLSEQAIAINMLYEWICSKDVGFTHAVTLTFAKKETDRVTAERTFGVFMHYLNERIFRRAYKSKLNKLAVAAVLEGLIKDHQRLHYHFAIKIPSYITERRLREEVQFCWDKANKARENYLGISWLAKKNGMIMLNALECGIVRKNRIKIRLFSSNGWVGYIAKEFNIKNMDCISEHCHF